VIVEVGGTVGDIEGQPFLEAIRQLRTDLGRDQALFVHVTFLPYIGATGELKTKPTQHSVRELRGIGIQPQIIVARTDHPVNQDLIGKIALFCDVDRRAVIPLETMSNIYEVPLVLEEAGWAIYCRTAWLADCPAALDDWREWVGQMRGLNDPVRSLLWASTLNCATPI
jgi:CTP synthase